MAATQRKKKREKKLEERESWGVNIYKRVSKAVGTSHSPAGERHAGIEPRHRNTRQAKRGELQDYRQAVHVRASLQKSAAQKLKDETMPTRIHVSTCNVKYIMPFQLLAVFFSFFFQLTCFCMSVHDAKG